jgi:hypothetical protein
MKEYRNRLCNKNENDCEIAEDRGNHRMSMPIVEGLYHEVVVEGEGTFIGIKLISVKTTWLTDRMSSCLISSSGFRDPSAAIAICGYNP